MRTAGLNSAGRRRIDRLITLIDEALNRQVNAILHHPDFQAMEARWRGLAMLVRAASRGTDVKVRILSLSWPQLVRNMERAADFDQSHLFDLIYNREFGMPGGEPYGLFIGDYALSPNIGTQGADNVSTLTQIGMVAAAAFCPFVCAAAPSALGLDSFADLSRVQDLSWLGSDMERLRWNRLRTADDSRFLGLVAPRVLMRSPYEPYSRKRFDGFPFRETIAADGSTLLWGNGAFAFATVVVRAFVETGWFADIRGVTQDEIDGGMLGADDLAPYDFGTESEGLSGQPPVEVRLTSIQEQQFSDLGLIPVATTYMSSSAIFNANQSLHSPQDFFNDTARQNARLAAMLQYVLCASRFSHYLKVIMRDQVGQIADARALQRLLEDWLREYTIGNDDADIDMRIRFPLRSASIEVNELPGKPGSFACTVRLQPHFQLDDVSTSFHLIAEMAPPTSSVDASSPARRISA